MKTKIAKTVFAGAAALLATSVAMPVLATDGTVVIRNAAIHTMASSQDEAQALAIDAKGIIVAVGKEADVLSKAGPDARVIDLGGKAVLPGFQDAHVHLIEAGVNEILCDFEPFATLRQTREAIEACAAETESEWVLGSGVSMPHLLDQTDDPVAVLDDIVPDGPALILDDIGHGAWANSKALQAAGYDTIKGNPLGGIILRDPGTGRPNGIVLENAQQKLRNLAFPDTPENEEFVYESMLPTLKTFAQNGISTISDAGGFWPQGHVKAWETAEQNGTLTVRAFAASLEKSGATVVVSSDFDADELSPLVKIQAALERPKEGARDVRTAVKWMTVNPARLLNQEDRTGTLEVGKFADIVVLERDIFDIPINEIGETKVEATLLQGKPVYDADKLFQPR